MPSLIALRSLLKLALADAPWRALKVLPPVIGEAREPKERPARVLLALAELRAKGFADREAWRGLATRERARSEPPPEVHAVLASDAEFVGEAAHALLRSCALPPRFGRCPGGRLAGWPPPSFEGRP